MFQLIHSVIITAGDDTLIKYEIYAQSYVNDYYGKIPYGTCRVIALRLGSEDTYFKVVNADVRLDNLFEANQAQPDVWYSDGPNRVSLKMVVEYLEKLIL